MSELKSIEKLRELAADINSTEIIDHLDVIGKFMLHAEWLESWHEAFDAALGEIEAEISERFIALPADEDGDVLRIGDVLEYHGESVMLNSLSWNGRRWFATETVASSGWYPVHLCTHVKPPTIEDVLREFAQGVQGQNGDFTELAIAEYADKLRELMKEGE